MRFIADEHVSRHVIEGLQADGHNVVSVAQQYPGISDEQIAAAARAEGRIVITEDTDFGELAVRQAIEIPGVLLIELPGMTSPNIAARIRHVVKGHADALPGALVVVEPTRIRQRRLPTD